MHGEGVTEYNGEGGVGGKMGYIWWREVEAMSSTKLHCSGHGPFEATKAEGWLANGYGGRDTRKGRGWGDEDHTVARIE